MPALSKRPIETVAKISLCQSFRNSLFEITVNHETDRIVFSTVDWHNSSVEYICVSG